MSEDLRYGGPVLDQAAQALIRQAREAPSERDARLAASSAPASVVMRACDLLHVPDVDFCDKVHLAEEVVRLTR